MREASALAMPAMEHTTVRAQVLASRYAAVREASQRLVEPLAADDFGLQSMPDASPPKWHLAHTSWFFETFVLEALGQPPHRPQWGYLFNSYYEAAGPRHERPRRGVLSRPTIEEIRAYRADVDARMLAALGADRLSDSACAVVELGLHHEQQHQELIVTDLKHGLGTQPLRPSYRTTPRVAAAPATPMAPVRWVGHDAGVVEIGERGEGFAFDNERPRHRVYVEAFELADRPVTCGEYLEFVRDGGYRRADLWLAAGYDLVRREDWQAPLYWDVGADAVELYTLDGVRALDPAEPVCHVSYYEADAYARWARARLPSEAEWETIAAAQPVTGNFAESGRLHPLPLEGGPRWFGDVWQWTSSSYAPYPGFRALEGALGEYNGKFMCNQFVLRGGSCATPESHVRATYRNYFPPEARWQFSGLRLARNA
jgi:ergothioneine biosynthesis protein EgtB